MRIPVLSIAAVVLLAAVLVVFYPEFHRQWNQRNPRELDGETCNVTELEPWDHVRFQGMSIQIHRLGFRELRGRQRGDAGDAEKLDDAEQVDYTVYTVVCGDELQPVVKRLESLEGTLTDLGTRYARHDPNDDKTLEAVAAEFVALQAVLKELPFPWLPVMERIRPQENTDKSAGQKPTNTVGAPLEDEGCDAVPQYLKAVERIQRQLGEIYATAEPDPDLPLTSWPDVPRTHRCAVDSRPDIERVYGWAYVESMRRMVQQQLASTRPNKQRTYQGVVTKLDAPVDLGHKKIEKVIVRNRHPEQAMVWVWWTGLVVTGILFLRIVSRLFQRTVGNRPGGDYIRRRH